MIVKRKDGFHVLSESGEHMGGPYPTKERVKKRLAQIEMFKSLEAQGKKKS